ncbi:anti-sigma factor family protein [Streptomyces sp. A5-4]|uniref:anti-sigma factor family protein n=1 Tax=Streptomyces sp. A5-4 TaxID=3384771 RepID=UPI003DA7BF99
MTSTAGMTQHPDVSEISDLAEGLLSPARTTDVSRHLHECGLCADVRDSLEEIRGLLGTLPGPQRMPADVGSRIDAALAAEALLDSTAPASLAAATTAPEETASVSRETDFEPDEAALSPADASPTDLSSGLGRPAGRPRGTTGPGRTRQAKRRRRNTVIGAVFGTAALGVGVLFLQSVQSPSDKESSAADNGFSASKKSGSEFSESTLKEQVRTLVAKQPRSHGKTAESDQPSNTESSPNAPMLGTDVTVPRCVQDATGRTNPPLAAEEGTYKGTKSFLVVLPHAADGTKVQAYVVDASCVGKTPTAKGKVLLTDSYPRQ